MTLRAWPVWTPGASLVGFMKGTTKHCYIQIYAVGLMVSKKIFLSFSHYNLLHLAVSDQALHCLTLIQLFYTDQRGVKTDLLKF